MHNTLVGEYGRQYANTISLGYIAMTIFSRLISLVRILTRSLQINPYNKYCKIPGYFYNPIMKHLLIPPQLSNIIKI